MRGSTRLLVTHQLQFLPQCDAIIVMKEGRIEAVGAWEELKQRGVVRDLTEAKVTSPKVSMALSCN